MTTPVAPAPTQLPLRGRRNTAPSQRAIGAATALALEVGYPALTAQRIATRGHLSRATFYREFTSVEDCLLAAYDTGAARVRQHLVTTPWPAGADGAERLTRGLAAVIDLLARDPALAHLLVAEIRVVGRAGIERDQATRADVLAAVRDAFPATSPATVETAIAALHGIVHQHVLDASVTELPALADTLADLTLELLGEARTG